MLELSAFMFFLVPNRWEERSVWTICIPQKTTGNDMDQWFLQSLVGNNFTKLGSFTGFTIQIHQSHRSVMEVEMEVENDGKHVAQKRWKLSLSCKLRDKNQDSSSAWKSAIYSVNNRFEGFSMLFLYGPGIGRIDVIFGMIKMPSSLLMFRFLQILFSMFSQIDVFFSKGWQNWCHSVTSAVAFRATKALWFDQSLLVAWRALCAAGCGGFPILQFPGLYIRHIDVVA